MMSSWISPCVCSNSMLSAASSSPGTASGATRRAASYSSATRSRFPPRSDMSRTSSSASGTNELPGGPCSATESK